MIYAWDLLLLTPVVQAKSKNALRVVGGGGQTVDCRVAPKRRRAWARSIPFQLPAVRIHITYIGFLTNSLHSSRRPSPQFSIVDIITQSRRTHTRSLSWRWTRAARALASTHIASWPVAAHGCCLETGGTIEGAALGALHVDRRASAAVRSGGVRAVREAALALLDVGCQAVSSQKQHRGPVLVTHTSNAPGSRWPCRPGRGRFGS